MKIVKYHTDKNLSYLLLVRMLGNGQSYTLLVEYSLITIFEQYLVISEKIQNTHVL